VVVVVVMRVSCIVASSAVRPVRARKDLVEGRGPTRDFSSPGVPSAMTFPRSMMASRSASWSASSRCWVVSSTVVPAATRTARFPYLVAAAGIQAGSRLVEEQQLRGENDAGRDVEPAAHAPE